MLFRYTEINHKLKADYPTGTTSQNVLGSAAISRNLRLSSFPLLRRRTVSVAPVALTDPRLTHPVRGSMSKAMYLDGTA